jgi:ADP-heptose:LPS heptosyltransferase
MCKKILIIQQKKVGDVLVTSILCNSIKKQFPSAEIHYMVYPHTVGVVENNPNIDKILVFETKFRNSIKITQLMWQVFKTNYDVVIDCYGKLESILMVFASLSHIKIGFKKKYNLWYSHRICLDDVAPSGNGCVIDTRLSLLGPLWFPYNFQWEDKPKLFLTENEKNGAKDFLISGGIDLAQPLVMFGILGGEKEKTWPIDFMIELIDDFIKKTQTQVIFNYLPEQKNEAQYIYQNITNKNKVFWNLYPQNIRLMAGVLTYCKLLIGNEGGAVHIAKAVNTATFTIFSPFVNPKDWAIFNDGIKNDYIHFKDIPEAKWNEKDLFKNHQKYYRMLTPEIVLEKALNIYNKQH